VVEDLGDVSVDGTPGLVNLDRRHHNHTRQRTVSIYRAEDGDSELRELGKSAGRSLTSSSQ
jgi:hypothetical protein